MISQQNLLAFLFAVCLIEGAFLAPVVAHLDRDNRRATSILAVLILCFLPMIGEELIGVANLVERFPHALGSSVAVDFLIAPLLLFHAWSITDGDRPLAWRDLVHLVPFALALLLLLPFYALSGEEKIRSLAGGLPASMRIVIAAKVVVGAVYLTAVIRHLRAFVGRAGNPRARDPHVVWYLRMMVGLAVVAVASLVIGLLPLAGVPAPIDSDALGTLFMCGSIYLISYLLIRHPFAAPAGPHSVAWRPGPRYGTSPLGPSQKDEYLDRLRRHMEADRPFLDMELSLDGLAQALDVRPGHLSQVLNERVGMNFYEFVSTYRVREAQARIADPAQSHKTLLAIAHEAGFNSKASFNRAFKRVTGLTPSEFARGRTAGNGRPRTSD